jgi:aminoglycoside phosphotransferase (APT) family kinase protein
LLVTLTSSVGGRSGVRAIADRIRGRLARYYAGRFPERVGVRIADLSDITSGWETEVYAFAVEYCEGGQRRREELILRIYPGGGASEKAGREFRAMQQLHRSGYPVPTPVLLEEDGSPFDWPFLIMEKVHGRPLGQIMDAAPGPERQKLLERRQRL